VIYLAGPISDCSGPEVMAWRQEATQALGGRVFDPIADPLRAEADPASIIKEDLVMIRHSSAVLANWWKESAGTAMEIFYARQLVIPVILVIQPGRISPWLVHHASYRVETLAEGIRRAREYLA